jgi:transcriptional regulator with XRE-family HTH domain
MDDMAQTPSTLTPHASPRHFLGAELRCWRQHRRLSLTQLGHAIHVSADLLCKVEKATRTPTEGLLRRCDEELRTDGALTRLLAFVEHLTAAEAAPAPQPILIKIIAEVVHASATEPAATPPGRARLYSLPRRADR